MNPLKSILGTIVAGFVISIIIALLESSPVASAAWSISVWLHVLAGVVWIGLLYYFNFVQVPAVATATADSGGPGPAAISKYVAPRALAWFRYGALVTWLTGAWALAYVGGFSANMFFTNGITIIGIGAWLGTIMLFNVWVLIWPNQKKLLGLVEATDAQKASAKNVAFLASRTNTMLSIPMLMCMVGHAHTLPI
ncbi:MAG: hypothetical protein CBC79_05165 [Gammaproteobacteria bacterium TMED119]|nr:MAG: hypothetical protein CBC79_05165 [Gammaproteobacteria bacterium TMED119]